MAGAHGHLYDLLTRRHRRVEARLDMSYSLPPAQSTFSYFVVGEFDSHRPARTRE